MSIRQKYAIVGASNRALRMFAKPIVEKFKAYADLVGICDTNKVRAEYISKKCGKIPIFSDFEQMIKKTRPEHIIVATIDKFHHKYIIRSLKAGCNVIVEKPMTIDAEKCKTILQTEKRTGRHVVVAFNFRFNPYVRRIKELLRQDTLGSILSVEFSEMLDTCHGADYFRRWHRRKENSGGLLVHKATHHFDAVNWWLEDKPKIVFAFGLLKFYGPRRDKRGERCLTCQYKDSCEFFVDFSKDKFMRQFYFDAEKEDGYKRDKCVFSEEINIEDTAFVNVKYSKGAILTYSLIAYNPYESWKVAINGTKGRIEAQEFISGQYAGKQPVIKVYNRRREILRYTLPKLSGTHSGADAKLQERIFRQDSSDSLGFMADSRAGALSLLTGVAANKSIAEQAPVNIEDIMEL